MTTYDIYRWIFIGGLAACGVCLVVAVILFFTMNIPKVISDLTGRTARKAIENIRKQNEQSGDKSYQSSAVNLERGKLTDKISRSGRLIPRGETPFGTGRITEKISTQKLDDVEAPCGETDVLAPEYGETDVLTPEYGETEVLTPAYGETEVLNAPCGETEVLAAPQEAAQTFQLEYEITYIHTDEVIA